MSLDDLSANNGAKQEEILRALLHLQREVRDSASSAGNADRKRKYEQLANELQEHIDNFQRNGLPDARKAHRFLSDEIWPGDVDRLVERAKSVLAPHSYK